MPVDPETFKQAMSRWASGVTIVTCRRESVPYGMTASAFCSVSLQPPLVLVCIDRAARTRPCIEEQRAFGVQILEAGMAFLSDRCAGLRGEDGQCLQDLPLRSAVTGAPILEHALAWLDCSLWQTYDGGDHLIFVGEVQAAGARDGEPLIWFDRGYRRIAR